MSVSSPGNDGLSRMCMMSVHRKRLERNTNLIENSIEEFGKNIGVYNYFFKNKYYYI
jgi:hypothetical protein